MRSVSGLRLNRVRPSDYQNVEKSAEAKGPNLPQAVAETGWRPFVIVEIARHATKIVELILNTLPIASGFTGNLLSLSNEHFYLAMQA
jgi:hypothetical protein